MMKKEMTNPMYAMILALLLMMAAACRRLANPSTLAVPLAAHPVRHSRRPPSPAGLGQLGRTSGVPP